MRLFLVQGCPFAHRVSFSLQQKALAFEPVFFAPGERPPELLALGKLARSPTLFDGDVRVWDSQNVLEYLEERSAAAPLLPASPGERAQCRMLSSRIIADLFSIATTLERALDHGARRDEAACAKARAELAAALPEWSSALATKSLLFSNFITLADITLYAALAKLEEQLGRDVLAGHDHLRTWYAQMSERPGARPLAPG